MNPVTLPPIVAADGLEMRPKGLEDFLRDAPLASERCEWVTGFEIVKSTTSFQHGDIVTLFYFVMGRVLAADGFKVYSESRMISNESKEEPILALPDFVAVRPPIESRNENGRQLLLNPSIVVEVLSPSTRTLDFLNKRPAYQLIKSLEYMLFIEQDKPLAEFWHRTSPTEWSNTWLRGPEAKFSLWQHEFTLGDFYPNE